MTYRICIFNPKNTVSVIQPFDLDNTVKIEHDKQGDAVWGAIVLRKKYKRSDIIVLDTDWKKNRRRRSFVLFPSMTL